MDHIRQIKPNNSGLDQNLANYFRNLTSGAIFPENRRSSSGKISILRFMPKKTPIYGLILYLPESFTFPERLHTQKHPYKTPINLAHKLLRTCYTSIRKNRVWERDKKRSKNAYWTHPIVIVPMIIVEFLVILYVVSWAKFVRKRTMLKVYSKRLGKFYSKIERSEILGMRNLVS